MTVKLEDVLAVVVAEIARHNVHSFAEIKNQHSQQYASIAAGLQGLSWDYDKIFESEPVYHTGWMLGWNSFLRRDPRPEEEGDEQRGYDDAFRFQSENGPTISRFKFPAYQQNFYSDERLSIPDYTSYRRGFDHPLEDLESLNLNDPAKRLHEHGIQAREQYDQFNKRKP